MNIEQVLRQTCAEALRELYNAEFDPEQIIINITPKEFAGDLTLVVFPFLKFSKKNPEITGEELGKYFVSESALVDNFNVIKGFLNFNISKIYWLQFLNQNFDTKDFGKQPPTGQTIVLEYCGPNTNKPLHLGHVRNMLLGYSVASILAFNGHDVHKVNIYNDRGIAICKSMVAWLKDGRQATPEATGKKGDQLVGDYYIAFDRIYKQEVDELIHAGQEAEEARKNAPILIAAQTMLRKWEAGDADTMELWQKMNSWVYKGFEDTYRKLGVDFEKNYYESETYLLGKKQVEEGLEKGLFIKKEDGSVWVDLTDKGLDEKILLRSDGTSVYLTQDLGTAQLRYDDYKMDQSIYVVANEQDYHFQVLKLTLEKLGKSYAEGIHHLSYGMVDLPEGKMKSREGTVVDADDLINDMWQTAAEHTEALGKIEGFNEEEAHELYRKIGLGALKFFILRVDPLKRILFDPAASIDFHGQTGPFVQYTYARIQSVLNKAEKLPSQADEAYAPNEVEKELIIHLHQYPQIIREAGKNFSPSLIANYAYNVAKTYNKFYAECHILKAEDQTAKDFRLILSQFTANIIESSFALLGIEVPDRM